MKVDIKNQAQETAGSDTDAPEKNPNLQHIDKPPLASDKSEMPGYKLQIPIKQAYSGTDESPTPSRAPPVAPKSKATVAKGRTFFENVEGQQKTPKIGREPRSPTTKESPSNSQQEIKSKIPKMSPSDSAPKMAQGADGSVNDRFTFGKEKGGKGNVPKSDDPNLGDQIASLPLETETKTDGKILKAASATVPTTEPAPEPEEATPSEEPASPLPQRELDSGHISRDQTGKPSEMTAAEKSLEGRQAACLKNRTTPSGPKENCSVKSQAQMPTGKNRLPKVTEGISGVRKPVDSKVKLSDSGGKSALLKNRPSNRTPPSPTRSSPLQGLQQKQKQPSIDGDGPSLTESSRKGKSEASPTGSRLPRLSQSSLPRQSSSEDSSHGEGESLSPTALAGAKPEKRDSQCANGQQSVDSKGTDAENSGLVRTADVEGTSRGAEQGESSSLRKKPPLFKKPLPSRLRSPTKLKTLRGSETAENSAPEEEQQAPEQGLVKNSSADKPGRETVAVTNMGNAPSETNCSSSDETVSKSDAESSDSGGCKSQTNEEQAKPAVVLADKVQQNKPDVGRPMRTESKHTHEREEKEKSSMGSVAERVEEKLTASAKSAVEKTSKQKGKDGSNAVEVKPNKPTSSNSPSSDIKPPASPKDTDASKTTTGVGEKKSASEKTVERTAKQRGKEKSEQQQVKSPKSVSPDNASVPPKEKGSVTASAAHVEGKQAPEKIAVEKTTKQRGKTTPEPAGIKSPKRTSPDRVVKPPKTQKNTASVQSASDISKDAKANQEERPVENGLDAAAAGSPTATKEKEPEKELSLESRQKSVTEPLKQEGPILTSEEAKSMDAAAPVSTGEAKEAKKKKKRNLRTAEESSETPAANSEIQPETEKIADTPSVQQGSKDSQDMNKTLIENTANQNKTKEESKTTSSKDQEEILVTPSSFPKPKTKEVEDTPKNQPAPVITPPIKDFLSIKNKSEKMTPTALISPELTGSFNVKKSTSAVGDSSRNVLTLNLNTTVMGNQEVPSSWLDVDNKFDKKPRHAERNMDCSASDDDNLDTSDDFDDFIRNIKELGTPFSIPPRRHSHAKTPSPPFAMPAIEEDRFEKPFDPESFDFGKRKKNFAKDQSPASIISRTNREKTVVQRKRLTTEDSMLYKSTLRNRSEERTGREDHRGEGKLLDEDNDNDKDKKAAEDGGLASSRLGRISILSSLMQWEKPVKAPFSAKSQADAVVSPAERTSPTGEAQPSPTCPSPPSFTDVRLPDLLEKYVRKNDNPASNPQTFQPPSVFPMKENNIAPNPLIPGVEQQNLPGLTPPPHIIQPPPQSKLPPTPVKVSSNCSTSCTVDS